MAEATGQGITGEIYKAIIAIVDERVRAIRVTREDFDELKAIVKELAQAQARTEARLEELAQAQARTEARLEELAQAQARTEARLDSLTLKVEGLAQAQARTEARLDSLTVKVEELAEAQLKTEKIVQKLVVGQDTLKKQVAGLSDTVGYGLEDKAIAHLPALLQKDHGITVNFMDRRFIEYPNGKDDEINIYGEGTLDGEPIHVIGESKSQLGRKDVDRFKKLLKRTQTHLPGRIIPILVTYSLRPKVEQYAHKAIDGLVIYRSYQLQH